MCDPPGQNEDLVKLLVAGSYREIQALPVSWPEIKIVFLQKEWHWGSLTTCTDVNGLQRGFWAITSTTVISGKIGSLYYTYRPWLPSSCEGFLPAGIRCHNFKCFGIDDSPSAQSFSPRKQCLPGVGQRLTTARIRIQLPDFPLGQSSGVIFK